MTMPDSADLEPDLRAEIEGPENVNATIVVRVDDESKQPMIGLTTRTQKEWEKEATKKGYTPISFLGTIPSLCNMSLTSRGLEINMLQMDAVRVTVEELLNTLVGPMFSLGHQTGRQRGYKEGLEAGDATGYERGKADGIAEGDGIGYKRGHTEGRIEGIAEGKVLGAGMFQHSLNRLLAVKPAELITVLESDSHS